MSHLPENSISLRIISERTVLYLGNHPLRKNLSARLEHQIHIVIKKQNALRPGLMDVLDRIGRKTGVSLQIISV